MSFTVRECKELDLPLRNSTTTMRDLAEALPHGSGVDCQWDIWAKSNGTEFHNSYHSMNKNGMYDGWHNFKVVLFRHRREEKHPLKGICEGKFQITHRKGDWDFRIVGLNGKMADVKEMLYEDVGMAWEKFDVGKLRQEIV